MFRCNLYFVVIEYLLEAQSICNQMYSFEIRQEVVEAWQLYRQRI